MWIDGFSNVGQATPPAGPVGGVADPTIKIAAPKSCHRQDSEGSPGQGVGSYMLESENSPLTVLLTP